MGLKKPNIPSVNKITNSNPHTDWGGGGEGGLLEHMPWGMGWKTPLTDIPCNVRVWWVGVVWMEFKTTQVNCSTPL